VFVGGLSIGACDSTDEPSTSPGQRSSEDIPAASGPTTAFSDASAAGQSETKRGICGVTNDQCMPDHDGHEAIDAGPSCVTPADAAPTGYRGCRMKREPNGDFIPQCGNADSRGVEGMSCATGLDCAPGFDCVEGEKSPVCRRYCCTGSCEGQLSANGGPTFCDLQLQKSFDLDQHKVPVCMPIKTCKLLQNGECSETETCAIVTEKGDTGCVPKGNRKAGEACDDEQCDGNLTCLGNPGDRRCYKLCRIDGSDCAPTETCTTGAVFQDTTFGVCKAG
jgi:hypothetical protein